jgi:hypothetical protein
VAALSETEAVTRGALARGNTQSISASAQTAALTKAHATGLALRGRAIRARGSSSKRCS